MKGKKGQITFYLYFIIFAFVMIVLAALLAPMGVLFTTEMIGAGERILNNTQADLDDIQDTDIRESLNNTIISAMDTAQDNIEVNSSFFQYSWVFIIILSALGVFLLTRRIVEVTGGGVI